jgi:hypothetical protein
MGRSTRLLATIVQDDLSTGDALVAAGRQVRLFEHWTDPARTRYLAYDFGSTPVKHRVYTWNGASEYRYIPVRLIGSR